MQTPELIYDLADAINKVFGRHPDLIHKTIVGNEGVFLVETETEGRCYIGAVKDRLAEYKTRWWLEMPPTLWCGHLTNKNIDVLLSISTQQREGKLGVYVGINYAVLTDDLIYGSLEKSSKRSLYPEPKPKIEPESKHRE